MKKQNKLKLPPMPVPLPPIVPPVELRIDLGCGSNKRANFTGVDTISFPGVDIVTDLKQEWPFEDNSVTEANSSHFIEHLTGLERVHFWNELYRVLKPGAKATIIAPHWSSCRAYGDFTHKWPPISEFSLFYVSRDWRLGVNGVGANAPHTDEKYCTGGYNCNFQASWGYSLEPGVAARNQEYQQHAITYWKEAAQDIIITVSKS